MDKKEKSHVNIESTKFVLCGFVLLIFFSVAVFALLGTYMSRKSEEAIDDLGNMYMTSMGERICKHFETIVNLRLKQAEAVATVVSVDEGDQQEIYEELIYRTEVRDFISLSLCSEDGEFETLYGESATLIDPEPFLGSLRKGDSKVAVAVDDSGEQVVLFGVNAQYPMSDGRASIATVMAIPALEISEELSLEKESIEMYAHIIRTDGTFIIRDESIQYPDYFSYLRGTYTGEEDRESVEHYVEDLAGALKENRSYVDVLEFGGHIHAEEVHHIAKGEDSGPHDRFINAGDQAAKVGGKGDSKHRQHQLSRHQQGEVVEGGLFANIVPDIGIHTAGSGDGAAQDSQHHVGADDQHRRQQEGQGRPRPGHGDADTGKGHDAGADDLADADTHTVPKT